MPLYVLTPAAPAAAAAAVAVRVVVAAAVGVVAAAVALRPVTRPQVPHGAVRGEPDCRVARCAIFYESRAAPAAAPAAAAAPAPAPAPAAARARPAVRLRHPQGSERRKLILKGVCI